MEKNQKYWLLILWQKSLNDYQHQTLNFKISWRFEPQTSKIRFPISEFSIQHLKFHYLKVFSPYSATFCQIKFVIYLKYIKLNFYEQLMRLYFARDAGFFPDCNPIQFKSVFFTTLLLSFFCRMQLLNTFLRDKKCATKARLYL